MKINLNNLYISANDVTLGCRNKDEATYALERINDALWLMEELEQLINRGNDLKINPKDNSGIHSLLKAFQRFRTYDPKNK